MPNEALMRVLRITTVDYSSKKAQPNERTKSAGRQRAHRVTIGTMPNQLVESAEAGEIRIIRLGWQIWIRGPQDWDSDAVLLKLNAIWISVDLEPATATELLDQNNSRGSISCRDATEVGLVTLLKKDSGQRRSRPSQWDYTPSATNGPC